MEQHGEERARSRARPRPRAPHSDTAGQQRARPSSRAVQYFFAPLDKPGISRSAGNCGTAYHRDGDTGKAGRGGRGGGRVNHVAYDARADAEHERAVLYSTPPSERLANLRWVTFGA